VSPDGTFVAGCLDREVIAVWDIFTGKQLGALKGHRGDICSLCFSADGRYLVSASSDTTILVWDWKKNLPKTSESAKLSGERLEQLWQDLQASNPQRAYQAIRVLVQSPSQAISLLRKKMPSATTTAQEEFKQWIGDLDSDSYQIREKATKQLIRSGELAEASLRQALTGALSPEARSRVTKVVDSLPTAPPHSSTLATIRSLELLEMIGTPEARQYIEELCQQRVDSIRQREATQSLKRLHH